MSLNLIPAGSSVTVRSHWFPDLVVDVSGATGPTPPLWVRLLRPQVIVAVGGVPVSTTTPAGSPDPNVWPQTKLVVAVIVGLAVFGVLRVLK